MKRCTKCKYGMLWDYGYSNYTVEGTDFLCLLEEHPEAPFDNWYGEDSRHEYAGKCKHFVNGEGVWVDVDGGIREAIDQEHDGEIIRLLKKHLDQREV